MAARALLWSASAAVVWLLCISFAFADDSVAVRDGLLVNGDFESGPASTGTGDDTEEGIGSLPGWQINGKVEYIEKDQKQGNMFLVVPEGNHAVRLGNEAIISQKIKLEKDSTYSLTFSAARTCAQIETLNVSVPPASRTVDLQTLYNIHGWDAYAWAFKALSDDVEIRFHNPGMEDDPSCGPIIDAIALKKIFIPASSPGNQVVNGDFEEGPWMFRNASLSLGVLLPTNPDVTTSSVPGWIVESSKALRYIDSDHYKVPEGKRAVELLSGKEGIISQMVPTVAGRKYTMSFEMGEAGDRCSNPMGVMAFAGDQSMGFHLPVSTGERNNVTFVAKAERSRIAFYSIYYNQNIDDRSSFCGPVIDNVKVVDPLKSSASSLASSSFLLILSFAGLLAFVF